jgi:hypothetical protein
MFDTREYPEAIRFHSWLQINAIRFSIAPNCALPEAESLPSNVNPRVAQTWAAFGLARIDQCWAPDWSQGLRVEVPQPETLVKAKRAWWHLRTESREMAGISQTGSARMFEIVEELTERTTGQQSGPLVFSVHQILLGVELNKPIFNL